jgi:MoaA/NifB/PqqE/SkfB family radical SAM enzyme
MDDAPDRAEIMFTAGEPTLREDLPELMAYARSSGFAQIGLISNGRRFAYAPYLERLVESGLNHLVISIHGHTARIHDGLTRTPKSFEQTCAGLRNAQALRDRGANLRLVTATVLNRRNLGSLALHLRFLQEFGPDEMVLNVIQPLGGGARHFQRLVPRAAAVVEGVREAVAALHDVPHNLRLLDLPRCVTNSLPQTMVGFVEEHEHFEPASEVLEGATPEEDGDERSADVLVLVTKANLDEVLRVKGPDCVRCRIEAQCAGVWRKYAEVHGFDEFEPLP